MNATPNNSNSAALVALDRKCGAFVALKDGHYGNFQAGGVIFTASEWEAIAALAALRATPGATTSDPADDRAEFEAWFLAEKLKTFPKDYESWRLERWGEGYRASYEKAWFAARKVTPPSAQQDDGDELFDVVHPETER